MTNTTNQPTASTYMNRTARDELRCTIMEFFNLGRREHPWPLAYEDTMRVFWPDEAWDAYTRLSDPNLFSNMRRVRLYLGEINGCSRVVNLEAEKPGVPVYATENGGWAGAVTPIAVSRQVPGHLVSWTARASKFNDEVLALMAMLDKGFGTVDNPEPGKGGQVDIGPTTYGNVYKTFWFLIDPMIEAGYGTPMQKDLLNNLANAQSSRSSVVLSPEFQPTAYDDFYDRSEKLIEIARKYDGLESGKIDDHQFGSTWFK